MAMGWGQEDDGNWDEAVKAVDKVLGVEQDPTKRQRDEKLRREMLARGENPDESGCAASRAPGTCAASSTPNEHARAQRRSSMRVATGSLGRRMLPLCVMRVC